VRLQRSREFLLIETYAFRKFGVASTEVVLLTKMLIRIRGRHMPRD
jgi:hypothetical protein